MTKTVIQNGLIVSMDSNIGTVANADLLIADGAVVAIGGDFDDRGPRPSMRTG